MAKRTKMPTDMNSRARAIVELASSEEELPDRDEGKNASAVAQGRVGGLKGGKARAARLTAAERSQIAKTAAAARWRSGGAGEGV